MIGYYTTSILHLSLEPFYNAGLSPEEARTAIESIINPFQPDGFYSSEDRLRTERQFINGNWNVLTTTNNPLDHEMLVRIIEDRLDKALADKQMEEQDDTADQT